MSYENSHKGKYAWLSQFSHSEIKNWLKSILESYNVVLVGSKGECLIYNQQFKSFMQNENHYYMNQRHISDVFIELKDEQFFESIISTIEQNGMWSGKLQMICNFNKVSSGYVHIARINNDKHSPVFLFLFFKNELKKTEEEKWRRLAYTDELTDLSNWRKFKEQFSAIKKESDKLQKPFGLLFIDIDNFKELNDQYGHIAGDKFLQLCARRIRESIGENMHAFRKSGDEFLVIVKERELIEPTAKIIRNRLSEEFQIGNSVKRVSVSIGVSIYPTCGHDEESILHHADMSMYKDKMQGAKEV